MRHGLYPISPLYMMSIMMSIGRSALIEKTLASRLRSEPLQQSADVIDRMMAIDRVSLGASRSKHHGYRLSDGGLKGFSLWSSADCVGYAYLRPEGHIGPVAVTDADSRR